MRPDVADSAGPGHRHEHLRTCTTRCASSRASAWTLTDPGRQPSEPGVMRARRRVRPADSVEPAEVMPPGPHDGVVDGDDKAAGSLAVRSGTTSVTMSHWPGPSADIPPGATTAARRPKPRPDGPTGAASPASRCPAWRRSSGIAAYSAAYSSRCSITRRTVRSRSSLGYCFGMKIILPEKGVSTEPRAVHGAFRTGVRSDIRSTLSVPLLGE
jgi:hypothetical protein